MNHRNVLKVAVLATIAILGVGCASTQPIGTQIEDAAIVAKIETKLVADPEVNPFRVDVDVNEGVVRLSGVVEQPEAAAEAERLARNTEGVTRVINDIRVGEPDLGDRIDGVKVASAVKAKLAADPEINPFNINVDAEGGVVTLMGRVATQQAKRHAEQIAERTEGVERVKNLIEVGDRSSDR